MEKLNIVELLKDCPTGMELNCTIFEDVHFDYIDDISDIINCYIQDSKHKIGISFNKYGCYSNISKSKCVIYPKGKTTWEGFQRPFKDGDILAYQFPSFPNPSIYIHKYSQELNTAFYVALSGNGNFKVRTKYSEALYGNDSSARFATEEEKQKLFDAIKANGYRWNPATKTLEKLIIPKFKVGDRIKEKKAYISGIITDISDGSYKVEYEGGGVAYANIEFQDGWELVPDKFDITTLNPFDKVLVRTDGFAPIWTIDFYDGYNPNAGIKSQPFGVSGGKYFQQCIPYEGNEHLRGTTNDCDDFYKTWK